MRVQLNLGSLDFRGLSDEARLGGLLANYAEVRNGLAFVTGGGIDTVQTPQLPAVLNAIILVRLLLHRTETNNQHSLDVEIIDEDGQTIAKVQAGVKVALNS